MASYKHLSIKQENIDLYYKNKPRIFATVPIGMTLNCMMSYFALPMICGEVGLRNRVI